MQARQKLEFRSRGGGFNALNLGADDPKAWYTRYSGSPEGQTSGQYYSTQVFMAYGANVSTWLIISPELLLANSYYNLHSVRRSVYSNWQKRADRPLATKAKFQYFVSLHVHIAADVYLDVCLRIES